MLCRLPYNIPYAYLHLNQKRKNWVLGPAQSVSKATIALSEANGACMVGLQMPVCSRFLGDGGAEVEQYERV